MSIKRTVSALLGLILAATLVGGVVGSHAEENKSTVNYTLSNVYYLDIPATVTVDFEELSHPIGTITVSNVNIESTKCVKVALENAESLALINQKDQHEIHYSVVNGKNEAFTERCFTDNGTINDLSISITQEEWDAATSGDYTGTVTFNISCEDK